MFHNPYSNAVNLGIIGRHLLQHWKSIYRPGTNFPLISAASIFSRWWRSWIWWWQKGQYSKNVYLLAPNLPFKRIQSSVPIFWCWSGHWDNTKKIWTISGQDQDPNLKQIFCSLLVNVLRPQFCRRQLSNTSPALQDQRRKCHQKLCLVSFYYRICFFLLHKKCPDSHIFIGYVSKNGKVAAVNYVHLSFFFSE